MKSVQEYMALPWTYQISRYEDPHHGTLYVAKVVELKGCTSDGSTPQEAMDNIQEALELYIETCLEHGDPIPEPIDPSQYKGIITYRTKPERHARIAKEAQLAGLPINKWIDRIIGEQLESAS